MCLKSLEKTFMFLIFVSIVSQLYIFVFILTITSLLPFFQVCGWLTYSMDPQLHRTLFRAKSFKGVELSDFLGDLSVDDVFGIAIAQ